MPISLLSSPLWLSSVELHGQILAQIPKDFQWRLNQTYQSCGGNLSLPLAQEDGEIRNQNFSSISSPHISSPGWGASLLWLTSAKGTHVQLVMHKGWHPSILHTVYSGCDSQRSHCWGKGQDECQWQLKPHVFAQEIGVLNWKTSWNGVLHRNIFFSSNYALTWTY